jgi:hypothetical protein
MPFISSRKSSIALSSVRKPSLAQKFSSLLPRLRPSRGQTRNPTPGTRLRLQSDWSLK